MKIIKPLKKALIIIIIIVAFVGLINYWSSCLDEKKKGKEEREAKLEAGICVFDRENLDSLIIMYRGNIFRPISNLRVLKKTFSDELFFLNLNDSTKGLKSINLNHNGKTA